ncbi:MAG TPA: hypothetical protein P5239_06060 [Victivallales bacterium]|nr:hypothetical protein [Victivallales bacterium]
MLALTGMIIAGGMGLSSNLKAGGDSSINFDKTKYKLGDKATGKWKVDDGFQIVDSKSTENLSKPNIPHKNGPGSGTFEVNTLKYSNSVNDAKVFMMLKDKNTGISEKENNALRASCTIISFIGTLSGTANARSDKAQITVDGTGMPSGLGGVTAKILGFYENHPTNPNTPYTYPPSPNNKFNRTIVFTSELGSWIGVIVSAETTYAGFTFTAIGEFSPPVNNKSILSVPFN